VEITARITQSLVDNGSIHGIGGFGDGSGSRVFTSSSSAKLYSEFPLTIALPLLKVDISSPTALCLTRSSVNAAYLPASSASIICPRVVVPVNFPSSFTTATCSIVSSGLVHTSDRSAASSVWPSVIFAVTTIGTISRR